MTQRPDLTGIDNIDTVRVKHNDSLYTIGKNTLLKNKYGIWELYIEGSPLERGMVTGSLTRDLMHNQENAIMDKIQSLVPSKSYRKFLSKIIAWFNRKMYKYIPEEYKQEIYGITRFNLHKYDYFAPPYVRGLYLTGAHDIGHALQDFMLVGCTSFAAWDSKTADGQLLLGRNFDFYVGDTFAKQKIAAFFNPDKGYKFMMYTWGGMIGAVSGINEKGVSVTINAGRSKIPLVAKDPISLVAREILQYASNTQEAIAIAKKREVFVSEAIMVGSASERKAIIIEVSPKKFGVYEVQNSNELVCSNHFQSKTYANDKRNIKAIKESHSEYRFKRMQQLIQEKDKLTPKKAVAILRNRKGLDGAAIGYGNEKAIDQLLAHHGIVFKPEERKVWVSANPYQLGSFVAYDLDEAFRKFEKGNVTRSVAIDSQTIPEDKFIYTRAYKNYQEYRALYTKLYHKFNSGLTISDKNFNHLISLNPNFWKVYALAADYYFKQKEYKKATVFYKQALKCVVTTLPDKQHLQKMIRKSERKI